MPYHATIGWGLVFIDWKVHMMTSPLMPVIFARSKYCNTDGKSLWTTKRTLLKNKNHLKVFQWSILVSVWIYPLIYLSICLSKCLFVSVCVCVCVFVWRYIYIYIYIYVCWRSIERIKICFEIGKSTIIFVFLKLFSYIRVIHVPVSSLLLSSKCVCVIYVYASSFLLSLENICGTRHC